MSDYKDRIEEAQNERSWAFRDFMWALRNDRRNIKKASAAYDLAANNVRSLLSEWKNSLNAHVAQR